MAITMSSQGQKGGDWGLFILLDQVQEQLMVAPVPERDESREVTSRLPYLQILLARRRFSHQTGSNGKRKFNKSMGL